MLCVSSQPARGNILRQMRRRYSEVPRYGSPVWYASLHETDCETLSVCITQCLCRSYRLCEMMCVRNMIRTGQSSDASRLHFRMTKLSFPYLLRCLGRSSSKATAKAEMRLERKGGRFGSTMSDINYPASPDHQGFQCTAQGGWGMVRVGPCS